MEISKQLRGVIYIKWLTYLFAFDKNLYFAIFHYCIINFFSFFCAYITDKFWRYFCRIKNIIAKYIMNKRHYKSIFGCFFGFDRVNLLFYLIR